MIKIFIHSFIGRLKIENLLPHIGQIQNYPIHSENTIKTLTTSIAQFVKHPVVARCTSYNAFYRFLTGRTLSRRGFQQSRGPYLGHSCLVCNGLYSERGMATCSLIDEHCMVCLRMVCNLTKTKTLDLKTRGCEFDSRAGLPNNWLMSFG